MMGFWEASCAVEEVSYKISSIRNVVEILAEHESSNMESGAMWAVADMLGTYEENLMKVSEALMDAHRESKVEPPKKGKKK